jgi:galactose mutarotase-like enzyme
MLHLDNGVIRITVNPHGAELCSLVHLENNLEYIWQAGKEWPKHSPVLFPIVGSLKDDVYYHNDNAYTMTRHGFARDKNFSLMEQGPHRLMFRLQDDEETRKIYPFHFILEINYALIDDTLQVTYLVCNTGADAMYFSIGAHPAFNVPVDPQKNHEDYSLQFDTPVTAGNWHLEHALVADHPTPFLKDATSLKLNKTLFEKDALIFKGFESNTIRITDDAQQHGIDFQLNRAPYLGLWAAKCADFLCIEPWYGISDSHTTDQVLADKEGIQKLEKGDVFTKSWSVRVF